MAEWKNECKGCQYEADIIDGKCEYGIYHAYEACYLPQNTNVGKITSTNTPSNKCPNCGHILT